MAVTLKTKVYDVCFPTSQEKGGNLENNAHLIVFII